MYQLLIVDDEALAIRGIELGVKWDKIGISTVYKASNIRQAKEVFKSHAVDIMLCDIEMPQGNGLDLLKWVREYYPGTESIILTCHADFSYAKKALQLGSLDYVLKALTYDELEKVIVKAIQKIKKDQKLLEYSQFGELWCKNQPLLVEQFWLDIISGKIPANDDEICRAAAERDIAFSAEMKIWPVLINIIPQKPGQLDITDKILINEIKSSFIEIYRNEIMGQIIKKDKDNILYILQTEQTQKLELNVFVEKCKELITGFKKNYSCNLYFYIGSEIKACGLAEMTARLYDMEKNNVALKNEIFFIDNKPKQFTGFSLPDMNLWSSMISEKEYSLFIKEVTKYFDNLVRDGNIDSNVLTQFHQDFLQMVYSSLKQKKIQAHMLLTDAFSINLIDRATKSVSDMLIWIKHVIARIQEDTLNNEESLTIIEKVKRYIAIHISDNPTREDLAKYVYLNPDYLSRLFKKETGITMISYCQNVRLLYIKDLLLKTDMSIGKIATQLGYSNFSHFTRSFKELTGISPTEFRSNNKGDIKNIL